MLVEPRQSLKNLTTLEAEGALGPYGFRDALDYTRPSPGSRKTIVATFMAHHIGMSIVALNNAKDSRLLSDPSVAVLENEEAIFQKVSTSVLQAQTLLLVMVSRTV